MNKPKLNQPDVEKLTSQELQNLIDEYCLTPQNIREILVVGQMFRNSTTIEEVKKEWEDDGFKWEENEKFIFIFNRIYNFSIDKEKQRFSCFDVIGNGAMAHFITLEQNIRLTKTFRALG